METDKDISFVFFERGFRSMRTGPMGVVAYVLSGQDSHGESMGLMVCHDPT
ncbi:MAG: hypothetical protein ACK5LJ_03500 [Paracoccus sp. (in: a-proteobacteria)]